MLSLAKPPGKGYFEPRFFARNEAPFRPWYLAGRLPITAGNGPHVAVRFSLIGRTTIWTIFLAGVGDS